MTKRVKNRKVKDCQRPQAEIKGKSFFSRGGKGRWADNGQRGRKMRAGRRAQAFVALQLKDAFKQDCCQLWEKKHLFMEKYACNNGITKTEPVCPTYASSILCGIHCLEHHTFRSVVSIGEPNLALIP